MRSAALVLVVFTGIRSPDARADETSAVPAPAPPSVRPTPIAPKSGGELAGLNAPDAVRTGNRRLLGGDAKSALEAYRRAEELRPDAREIAFGEGLAHYDLGEYDRAREAFRKAAAAGDDLAVDARYSLATCDHREALDKLDQPKEALGLLEKAMRQYQDVLAERPEHAAAHDANYKAASMWRKLKQKMQRQQRNNKDKDNNDQDHKDDRKQQDSQRKQEQKDRQQDRRQPSKSKKDENEKDRQQQQEKEKQDQAKQKDDQQRRTEQQQAKQADEKEKVSREQAERQLREMVQAMRNRKKLRRQRVRPVPARSVDKDW